jgi:hypothetical protein
MRPCSSSSRKTSHHLRSAKEAAWESGKVAIATAPTITVRIAITIATIGRLMKRFDMFVSPVFDKRSVTRPTSPPGALASG